MSPLRLALAAIAAALSLAPAAARAANRALPPTTSPSRLKNLTAEQQKLMAATGPVHLAVAAGQPDIDKLVMQDMTDAGIPAASLAVLKGGRLVYTQGYTLAAAKQATIPTGPVTPTTWFRQASVSKTFTAVALYRQLQDNHPALKALGLETKVADILGDWVKPSAAFKAITVRELLAHSSGIDPNLVWEDTQVVAAAGHALPMSSSDLAHFVAKTTLVGTPGKTFVYNNAGYFMLAAVVTKLAGQQLTPDGFIAALKSTIGTRAHITHLRMAHSLFAEQATGEARYQDFHTQLKSVMSKTQPMVAEGYGDENLAAALGAGGLSVSAVEVARLVASIADLEHSPVLSQASLKLMFDNGAHTMADPNNFGPQAGRSGHGLDSVGPLANGQYSGQKGGLLETSQNMLYFETGADGISYVINWGGHTAKGDGGWYPRWYALLTIARAHDWGSADLFPTYGMPALNPVRRTLPH